jgi:hydroxymethylbilane synthase
MLRLLKMSDTSLIIGTRGSLLATTQTRIITSSLETLAGYRISEKIIRTEGDEVTTSLTNPSRPGVFVAALRTALLRGEVDVIVHSFKDLPSLPEDGIEIAAVPKREDFRDALISRDNLSLMELPAGARVGTSSPRRSARILHVRPDLMVLPMRGNVDTRLRKVEEGEYDAVVLAVAGLNRVGQSGKITEFFTPEVLLPAPAQGALAVECRSDDLELIATLSLLNDPLTRFVTAAERAVLVGIGATCATAIGALAQFDDGTLTLTAELSAPDADEHARAVMTRNHLGIADIALARELGLAVADEIRKTSLGSRLGSIRG